MLTPSLACSGSWPGRGLFSSCAGRAVDLPPPGFSLLSPLAWLPSQPHACVCLPHTPCRPHDPEQVPASGGREAHLPRSSTLGPQGTGPSLDLRATLQAALGSQSPVKTLLSSRVTVKEGWALICLRGAPCGPHRCQLHSGQGRLTTCRGVVVRGYPDKELGVTLNLRPP